MRRSRTDLVPMLAIIGGGAIGVLTFGPLVLWSPSDDVLAPGTVTGQVTDGQSGGSVAAVQVYISSLDLGGLTQQNGRYLLQNVPPGAYTLTVARIGYRTVEAQITVGGGQTVEQNFSVAEEALRLDGIIVTGTPGGTQRRAIGNQPLIYIDGVLLELPQLRVNNDTSGDGASVLDDFNPEDIESVEILKADAAVALYGEEASAGVIRISLKEARHPRGAELTASPVFTPMTVRPELTNPNEVMQALITEYPPILRDAEIGGQVIVWFFISEEGRVLDRRISQSSDHVQLDEAALNVADVFRFTPALNRDRTVQVWIELPITFQVR